MIASQYERWHDVFPEGTPEYRDRLWTEYYQRFEQFQKVIGQNRCPLIRYEDLAQNPSYWIPFIFEHCGLADIPETYTHIRPVSIGRYFKTRNQTFLSWECSQELKAIAIRYGYDMGRRRTWIALRNLNMVLHRILNSIARHMLRLLKVVLRGGMKHLGTPRLESLIRQLVAWRVAVLPPDEALRFLFRLDAAFYSLQGKQAVAYDGGTHTKHRHMCYHDFFVGRIHTGERVLDIGCGIGAVAYDVAEKAGANVLGIDLNANNIARARQHYAHPRVKYQIGDVLQGLPAGSFDVVILSNVLEHLPARVAFLHRVQTMVQPARILIRVPLFERDWRVPLKRELGVEWRLDRTHETEYTLESFTEEMAATGLTVVYQEVRWGEIWAELVPDGS